MCDEGWSADFRQIESDYICFQWTTESLHFVEWGGCVTYDLLRLSHMMNSKYSFYSQQWSLHPLFMFISDYVIMWRPWLYALVLLSRRLYAMARRSGLIIAAIDIGAVDDVGGFSENGKLRRAMKPPRHT